VAVEFEQGYLILAHNSETTDYVACARALAKSLRYWMPDCKICLVTDANERDPVFDIVKPFPFGDQDPNGTWKLSNDWQAFSASPFRETIKLEADMIVNNDISHWWNWFEHRDLVISQGVRNYQNAMSDCRAYRRLFDDNDLPDVYNAITYWRLSKTAAEFFQLVRTFFEQWNTVKQTLKYCDGIPANTDMIYAMVAKYMGTEKVLMPHVWPSIVHMKPAINFLKTDARPWTGEFVWELVDGHMRINTIEQHDIVHYHEKSFAKELEEYYGQLLASHCGS
jgi:hypothetical protein